MLDYIYREMEMYSCYSLRCFSLKEHSVLENETVRRAHCGAGWEAMWLRACQHGVRPCPASQPWALAVTLLDLENGLGSSVQNVHLITRVLFHPGHSCECASVTARIKMICQWKNDW